MLPLPSCEVLEVGAEAATCWSRSSATPSASSTSAARRIDVDLAFLGMSEPRVQTRRLHALPGLVRLVPRPAPRRATRSRSARALECVDYREHTTLSAGQVDDTPFGGGAGMVLRVDVVEAALRARYGVDPVAVRERRRVIALTPGGRLLDDGAGRRARRRGRS